jgi:hypothetical protein
MDVPGARRAPPVTEVKKFRFDSLDLYYLPTNVAFCKTSLRV